MQWMITTALAACLIGCGSSVEIETLSPATGPIEESFSEPAQTRLAREYNVSIPVDGRLGRIALEPGDRVTSGQTLAVIDRLPFEQEAAEARAVITELEQQLRVNAYDALEQTALIETQKAIEAFEEALKATDAQIEAEQARAEHAERELARVQAQFQAQAVPESDLDDAQLKADTALIELRKQEFIRAAMNAINAIYNLGPQFVHDWLGRKQIEREVIVQQLAQARARLVRAEHTRRLARVVSPINGVVLERFEDGGGPLPAGTPLLRLGDLANLEVVADVLTEDALRLPPGAAVELEVATGVEPLRARVVRVEPAAFTKLSSLGVEQQRVRVISAFDAAPPASLGVGYRLQARFITARKESALFIPRYSVLQARDNTWYVMKVASGALQRQPVTLGLAGDLNLEIRSGLAPGDLIAATPDASMQDGQKVKLK